MSECNPMSTLGSPGRYTANSRPIDLGKDEDVDEKERPRHKEFPKLVDGPVQEGFEGDYAELVQGEEQQPWEARGVVHVADSHKEEVLD
eukprot:CAMPEP_0184748262 /NCGR_PEP_ID=MMETSP0315-20130426/17641_1 /TAXON_ID=101924 /ORGANISM="Rhodosorus marinus, Strain UTEX LB 2760" /LENGTH=88 /DNA_ID=CAMNT_0027223087 /DNA_START=1 /DNA_END=264 /DNA_ORIENTATION=+